MDKYDTCIQCSKNSSPIKSYGVCSRCYMREYMRKNRIGEQYISKGQRNERNFRLCSECGSKMNFGYSPVCEHCHNPRSEFQYLDNRIRLRMNREAYLDNL